MRVSRRDPPHRSNSTKWLLILVFLLLSVGFIVGGIWLWRGAERVTDRKRNKSESFRKRRSREEQVKSFR